MAEVTIGKPIDYNPFDVKGNSRAFVDSQVQPVSPDVQAQREKVAANLIAKEATGEGLPIQSVIPDSTARATPAQMTEFNGGIGTPNRGAKIAAEAKRKPVFADQPKLKVTIGAPVDYDPFATEGGVAPSDFTKSLTAGAVAGAGMIAQGGGELLARGINTVGDRLGFDPKLRAINPLQGWVNDLIDARTPAAKKAEAGTQIGGEILKPSTWSMGSDPSVSGLALQGMNAIGQFAPNLGIALVTAGASIPAQLAIGATVGGLQALGGGAEEERAKFQGMTHEQLLKSSTLYQELVNRGVPQNQAKDAVAEAAALGGGLGNAVPSAAEGAFENFLIGALTRGKLKIPSLGAGIAGRTAAGAGAGAAMGGAEEAIEQVGQNVGSNLAVGGNRPLGADTLQQFVMGMLAEGTAGAGAGALSRGAEAPAVPPQPASGAAPAPPIAGATPLSVPPSSVNAASTPAAGQATAGAPADQQVPPETAGLPLSPIDQARADAQVLKAGGNVEDLAPNQSTRLKNATLLAVYGENAAVRHVVEGGQQFSALGEAMLAAAPTVERVRGTIAQNGQARDITPDIVAAIDELAKIKESGQTVAQVMAHGVPHDISYEGQQLMAFLDENIGNAKKLAAFLENYLHEVEQLAGTPSEARGRAFDIIQERHEARKVEEEKRQSDIKKRAFEKTEVAAKREKVKTTVAATQQHKAETVLSTIARARAEGSGLNREHRTAMELAFANAKTLKGKSNGKPSSESGGGVPSGTPSQNQAGAGQVETGNNSGAVSKLAAADNGGNARPDIETRNQASTEGDRGQQIAAESAALQAAKKKSAHAFRKGTSEEFFKAAAAEDAIRKAEEPVDQAAHEAATSPKNELPAPTQEQIDAGNYKMGAVKIGGLDISIENPKGSIRRSHPDAALKWKRTMQDHYGYVKGVPARAPDKAHVDVFVKPGTPEDYDGAVFVVDQNNADGSFDEPKVMIGYDTLKSARAAYLRNYQDGWEGRINNITEMTLGQFKAKLQDVDGFMNPQGAPDFTTAPSKEDAAGATAADALQSAAVAMKETAVAIKEMAQSLKAPTETPPTPETGLRPLVEALIKRKGFADNRNAIEKAVTYAKDVMAGKRGGEIGKWFAMQARAIAKTDQVTSKALADFSAAVKDLPEVAQPKAELTEAQKANQERFVREAAERRAEKADTPFSRAANILSEKPVTGTSRSDLEGWVSPVLKLWKNAPEVVFIQSMADAPESVRQNFLEQNARGATGVPAGFWSDGKAWLVGDGIKDQYGAMETLFHESLGHYGLRGAFGDALKPMLGEIAIGRKADVERKMKEYGYDPASQPHRLLAAEEVLANLAQTHPELGIVKRAIAAVRNWLRDHGINLEWTNNDLIQKFILPARAFVENGGKVDVGGDVAFGRKRSLAAQLRENGEQPSSRMDAERRHAAGERIYGFHEQSEDSGPMLLKNASDFDSYLPEQMLALPANTTAFSLVHDAVNNNTIHAARDLFNTITKSDRVLNRVISKFNTPYHIAETNPAFKPVYDEAQDYNQDVSRFANESADAAPDLLPRIESFADFKKQPPSNQDIEAVADALYAGTLHGGASPLDGRVWTDEELKYGQDFPALNDKQVGLYRQALASIAKSLDSQAASLIWRLAKQKGLDVNSGGTSGGTLQMANWSAGLEIADLGRKIRATGDEKAQARLQKQIDELRSFQNDISDIDDKVQQLIEHGYFPAMRFGQYAVNVQTWNGVEWIEEFFGRYETQAAANLAKDELTQEYPNSQITSGVMNDEAYKLFQGLNMDALELFAKHMTDEQGNPISNDPVMQQYFRVALTERSTLKRQIHRKGTPGFSKDVSRALAQFTVSNATAASRNIHAAGMLEKVQKIKEGDLQAYATRYVRYLQDPQEESPALRGFLANYYILGSIAFGAVNMTQPVLMTAPYLSAHTSWANAMAQLGRAAKDMVTKRANLTPDEKQAYDRASNAGIVSPQEIHQIRAESQASMLGDSPLWQKLEGILEQKGIKLPGKLVMRKIAFLWGSVYSMTEQFNRGITFLSAYRIAKANGEKNPYEFAKNTVDATQGVYARSNRPEVSRGAIGATLMTFKQFSISYVEMAKRLYGQDKKAFAVLMLTLMALAGTEGLPFAEDVEDIIDTVGQWMGYPTNSRKALRKRATDILGKDIADVLLHGASAIPGVPIDVSNRLGMHNLIPGTALLKTSEPDKTRDITDLLGPAASLFKNVGTAVEGLATGKPSDAKMLLPLALQNAFKGAEMVDTGQYRDTKGRKVMDVNVVDALFKTIGFQPAAVARETRIVGQNMQDIALHKVIEDSIAGQLARGVADKDAADVAEAIRRWAEWNKTNPAMPIAISAGQVARRVKEMQLSREERFVKSAPKEIRGEVRQDIRQ